MTTTASRAATGSDPEGVRRAFGRFCSGVSVVTTRGDDGVPHGATANSFTAVSCDPPLAQVTLLRTARAARILGNEPFAINVLSAAQTDAARHFAGEDAGPEPEWEADAGVPVLRGNLATLRCRPWNIYDGGDHIIVVGEVVGVDTADAEPLVAFDGGFRRLGGPLRPDAEDDGGARGRYAAAYAFRPFGRPAG